jgi:hypothetical protein
MPLIAILFLASAILTAVFSYSLQFYLQTDFVTLSLKTMLIPCFTWSVLMLLAWRNLGWERLLEYLKIAGWVCAVGSAVLVPGGIYNFYSPSPNILVSVLNVFFCVVLMSGMFKVMLKKAEFPVRWWWAYNVLICVNMSLFYASTRI